VLRHPPVTAQDLSALPVVVGIFVQKMMDQPAQRSIIRDKLADYVLRESQGAMSIGAARTLNRILADLELAPVRVPEAAAVGPLEAMVRQHRSIDQVWDGTRYVPMPEADRVAREWAMNQVISEIKNLGVPFPSLTEREQYEAREILWRALRSLGPSPTV
jgi:hypothetical protein